MTNEYCPYCHSLAETQGKEWKCTECSAHGMIWIDEKGNTKTRQSWKINDEWMDYSEKTLPCLCGVHGTAINKRGEHFESCPANFRCQMAKGMQIASEKSAYGNLTRYKTLDVLCCVCSDFVASITQNLFSKEWIEKAICVECAGNEAGEILPQKGG